MTGHVWKWISRADARTGVLVAGVLLVGTVAYWAWREYETAVSKATFRAPPPVSENGAGSGEGGIGLETIAVDLLAFIERQRQNGERALSNPFFRPVAPRPPRPDPTPSPKPPTPSPTPPVPQPAPPPPPPTPKPPPPPPPPPVKETPVLYRGLMVRPDGAIAVLLENLTEKRQRYVLLGQAFLNGTVEAANNDEAVWRREDGVLVHLPRMKTVTIRER